jgi:hypothetical protein
MGPVKSLPTFRHSLPRSEITTGTRNSRFCAKSSKKNRPLSIVSNPEQKAMDKGHKSLGIMGEKTGIAIYD